MMDHRKYLVAGCTTAGVVSLTPSFAFSNVDHLHAVALRVDYIDRPLGLDNPRPRLSWRLESNARNVRQSAYRIWVASSEAILNSGRGDLWDSGRVHSKGSFGVPYEGRELLSRERCW
jgi:alpha-L-rhamnosidase